MNEHLTPGSDVAAEVEAIFGVKYRKYQKARRVVAKPPNAILNLFLRVVEQSGALEMLEKWDQERSPGRGGRPPIVSYKAILVVFIMNAFWNRTYGFDEIADTIIDRLSPKQKLRLGIRPVPGTDAQWYDRAWAATRRLRDMTDPWHEAKKVVDHRGMLTGDEYQRAKKLYDLEREMRAHHLHNAIVITSARILHKRYLEGHQGDYAVDSTPLMVTGLCNPGDGIKAWNRRKAAAKDSTLPRYRDRTNRDFESGPYVRPGDHNGKNKSFGEAAFEVDMATLIDAKNGKFAFPLIPAVYLHRPGNIKKGPKYVIKRLAEFSDTRGIIPADRAFNNLLPHHFQETVRRLHFTTAFDYKKTQLGLQGKVPNQPIILADGQLYVDCMLEIYVEISRWYAEKKVNPNTGKPYTSDERDRIIALREPYLVKPLADIDADGSQRYKLPDPSTYTAYDRATGKRRPKRDRIMTKTFTLGLEPDIIRHLQKYAWKSPKWKIAYGQRNQIESRNAILKSARYSNIGDMNGRTGRGFAYTYLCLAAAVVATNLRAIVTGLKKLAERITDRIKSAAQRKKQRTDSRGRPLKHSGSPKDKGGTDPPGISP